MIINDSIDSHRHDGGKGRDRFFKIRNVLNILFMAIAIIGIALYFLWSHAIGTIVILVGCAFKFVECSLRLIK